MINTEPSRTCAAGPGFKEAKRAPITPPATAAAVTMPATAQLICTTDRQPVRRTTSSAITTRTCRRRPAWADRPETPARAPPGSHRRRRPARSPDRRPHLRGCRSSGSGDGPGPGGLGLSLRRKHGDGGGDHHHREADEQHAAGDGPGGHRRRRLTSRWHRTAPLSATEPARPARGKLPPTALVTPTTNSDCQNPPVWRPFRRHRPAGGTVRMDPPPPNRPSEIRQTPLERLSNAITRWIRSLLEPLTTRAGDIPPKRYSDRDTYPRWWSKGRSTWAAAHRRCRDLTSSLPATCGDPTPGSMHRARTVS